MCDCCVRGFDHHCLWLGTCIGERNYLYFQMYVLSLNLALPFAIYLSIAAIWHRADEQASNITLACLLGLYTLILVVVDLLLLFLFCFHIYLLCLNQTTYERVKNLFRKVPTSPNPFQLGSFLGNFRARARQQLRADSTISLLVDVIGARKTK